MRRVIYLLMMFLSISSAVLGQELYNGCAYAYNLCPGVSANLNNFSANVTVCGGCEDDYNTCFIPANSIWVKFTTNATGGNVNLNFSNLNFQADPNRGTELQAKLISAGLACNSASYLAIGTCVTNASGNFSLNAPALAANTTYFLIINGAKNVGTLPAACTFDLSATGPGIDRPVSTINYTSNPAVICKNDLITFTANTTNCPNSTNFEWFVNGTLAATTTTSIFQTNTLNTGDLLQVSTNCYSLCPVQISSTSLPVNVLSFPLDAGPDFTIKAGETVQLQGISSQPIFTWAPLFNLANPTSLSPLVSPQQTTSYYLSASDGVCTLIDEATVFIIEKLTFTNTFSPNGDGANDTWEIKNISAYPDCQVWIYDRWGQLIFETIGYNFNNSWNGERNGKLVPAGTYFYHVELNSNEDNDTFRGYLNCIR